MTTLVVSAVTTALLVIGYWLNTDEKTKQKKLLTIITSTIPSQERLAHLLRARFLIHIGNSDTHDATGQDDHITETTDTYKALKASDSLVLPISHARYRHIRH
jgi:hypothetical protein